MSTTPSRVYAARLVGLPIFDPQGDQVGKVRDLVVAIRQHRSAGNAKFGPSEANKVTDNFDQLGDASTQDLLNFLRSL